MKPDQLLSYAALSAAFGGGNGDCASGACAEEASAIEDCEKRVSSKEDFYELDFRDHHGRSITKLVASEDVERNLDRSGWIWTVTIGPRASSE